MKIVDEHGDIVPMGNAGEIITRCPLTFHGYLHEEDNKGIIHKLSILIPLLLCIVCVCFSSDVLYFVRFHEVHFDFFGVCLLRNVDLQGWMGSHM